MLLRQFSWNNLGGLRAKRSRSRPKKSGVLCSLLQSSLMDVVAAELGVEEAEQLMREAGETAGRLLYDEVLAGTKDLGSLLVELASFLKANGAWTPQMLETDQEKLRFVFTVLENPGGSDVPTSGNTKGKFREGLMAAVLSGFLGRRVEEIDCRCEARPPTTWSEAGIRLVGA